MTWSENSGSSKNDGFLPIQKISNEFQKNINFGLLIDFDKKIRLNGSDRLFLT